MRQSIESETIFSIEILHTKNEQWRVSRDHKLNIREHFYQLREDCILMGDMQMEINLVYHNNTTNIFGFGERRIR